MNKGSTSKDPSKKSYLADRCMWSHWQCPDRCHHSHMGYSHSRLRQSHSKSPCSLEERNSCWIQIFQIDIVQLLWTSMSLQASMVSVWLCVLFAMRKGSVGNFSLMRSLRILTLASAEPRGGIKAPWSIPSVPTLLTWNYHTLLSKEHYPSLGECPIHQTHVIHFAFCKLWRAPSLRWNRVWIRVLPLGRG